MSPEVLQVILVLGGAVAGWIARHFNVLSPQPASPATPATPAPAATGNTDALWQLVWHVLREKFPNLPPLDPTK